LPRVAASPRPAKARLVEAVVGEGDGVSPAKVPKKELFNDSEGQENMVKDKEVKENMVKEKEGKEYMVKEKEGKENMVTEI